MIDAHTTCPVPVQFSKFEATGNDFVLLDELRSASSFPMTPALARSLCDRHLGVGADGVLVLQQADDASARLIIYNADGSRPEMCGNGLRCAALHLAEHHRVAEGLVLTDAGPRSYRVHSDRSGSQRLVTVSMGSVDAPVRTPVAVADTQVELYATAVGNPHAVLINPAPGLSFEQLAPLLSAHPIFCAGTNVEFVELRADNSLLVRVWERGVGPTLACGTGACAAAMVARYLRLVPAHQPLTVHLPGGSLLVDFHDHDRAQLTGPARRVFDGCLAPGAFDL